MASKGVLYEDAAPRAWAAEMASLDGYIFVAAEYNGMPGSTKNAIDFLYGGFVEKPVAVVSYGVQGGSFANEQTRAVLARMALTAGEPAVELAFAGGLGPDAILSINEGKFC